MTGQMSIFDFLKEDPTKLPCDDCKHDIDGCCDYDEPLGDYCVMGNKAEPKDTTLNRKGEVEDAPDWYSKERCEKCQHWEFSPNQPPAGWGVKGFCTSHRGQGREVGSTSYCQDFKRRLTAECNGCSHEVYLGSGNQRHRSCDAKECEGWKPKAVSCHTCRSYGTVVDAYTCEPTGEKACFMYEAWSQNLNLNPHYGCEYWELRYENKSNNQTT